MDEQQDLQALAAAGETTFHALVITMGLQVAEGQLDLHPPRVERDKLPCLDGAVRARPQSTKVRAFAQRLSQLRGRR